MDRMTETEARELLEYIYNKPSYLFLGQAYQRESLNKNSYLDKLYAEAGCSDSIHSWRNLLEDHSDSIDQIYDTAADLSVSVSVPFLSELVNLPWNLFITSSPEKMINCQGVELIPAKIDHLSQDIFTKAPKHRLHLFGCYDRDSHDSDSQPPKSVDDLDSFGVKAKVAWSAIKAKINGGSAVLVVDGWDPDGDWFQEEDFLPDLASWHDNPIYFFDVDNDQLQDTRSVRLINKRLKEDGSKCNIHFFSGTLRENIQEALEQYKEESYEWSADSISNDEHLSVTLECAGRKKIFSLPDNILRDYETPLPNVSFLGDDIESCNPPVTEEGRKTELITFLAHGNDSLDPYWKGFHAKNNWYLPRGADLDKNIYDKTKANLEQSDIISTTKVTLLPGSSYSGKSVVLANLAYRIKCEHQFPVVFIRGRFPDEEEPKPQSLKNLEEMLSRISDSLNEQSKTAENPQGTYFKILVIWDRNSLLSSKIYVNYKKALDKALTPYKVVLVGSTLDVNLQPTKNLDYFDNLDRAPLTRGSEKALFDRISPWFGQQFDTLYDKVFKAYQGMRRSDLGDINYDYTKYSTVKYTDVFLRVLDEICSSSGSWTDLKYRDDQQARRQESIKGVDNQQIDSIVKRMLRRDVRAPISEKVLTRLGVTDLTKDVTDCVQKCNTALAVSSCFNIDFPMEIVYSILSPLQRQCHNLSVEDDILRHNNMLYVTPPSGGFHYVRYLHFDDALSYVKYIAKKHNRSATEIAADAICDTIAHSSLNQETELTASSNRLVLNLVRHFSPNSPNEVSEDSEEMNKDLKLSSVICDKELYLKIARALDKRRNEVTCNHANEDARLIADTLRREQYSIKIQGKDVFFSDDPNEPRIRKTFDDAYNDLREMVKKSGDDKMAMRASAEICANRVRLFPPPLMKYGRNIPSPKNI